MLDYLPCFPAEVVPDPYRVRASRGVKREAPCLSEAAALEQACRFGKLEMCVNPGQKESTTFLVRHCNLVLLGWNQSRVSWSCLVDAE